MVFNWQTTVVYFEIFFNIFSLHIQAEECNNSVAYCLRWRVNPETLQLCISSDFLVVFQLITNTCKKHVILPLLKSNITLKYVWELTDMAGLWICHGTFMIDAGRKVLLLYYICWLKNVDYIMSCNLCNDASILHTACV